MRESPSVFRQRVRELIAAKRLDQKTVAERADMHASQLNVYLKEDGTVPTLKILDRIAAALEVDPWELITPKGINQIAQDSSAERLTLVRDLFSALSTFDDSQMEVLMDTVSALKRIRGGSSGDTGAVS